MKLHRSLIQAVGNALQQIFVEGIYADKAVERMLKQNSRWGSRDRRFIAETTYEMVRWWRYICETYAASYSHEYKIETLNNTSHFLKLFATWHLLKGFELPYWEEFNSIDKNKILKNAIQIKLIRKYRESIPDWLDDIGVKQLGEKVWENELQELNKEAQVVLRVNTLKIKTEELRTKLLEQNIEVSSIANASTIWDDIKKNTLIIKRQNLHQMKEYKEGLFEIQDAASQLIATFLQLNEGLTVVDACAGAGGKSLQIAAIMKNKGKIISMDIEDRKLVELKKRAARAGISIIQTELISKDSIQKLKNTADRLLLDVPCSGLGILRRNPDAKWKLNLDFIEKIKIIQQNIISNYSAILKPGGIMVYATCSILPSENQDQVEQFLSIKTGEFKFIADRKVLPSDGFDGFYMAAIQKL